MFVRCGFALGWILSLILGPCALAQGPVVEAAKKAEADRPKEPAKKNSSAESRLANADRIAKLENFLRQDQELRAKIKTANERLSEEVRRVSKELGFLQEQMKAKTEQRNKVEKTAKAEELAILAGEIEDLRLQEDLARKQLDLTVKERKVVQERLTSLDQKILQNQLMLDMLLGGDSEGKSNDKVAADGRADDPRLKRAREEARQRESLAKEADVESKSLSQRIQTLKKFLELDKSLIETESAMLDLLLQKRKAQEAELQRKIAADAAAEEIEALVKQVADADHRAVELKASIEERSKRIGRLQVEVTAMQQEQTLLDEETAKKKAEADRASAELERLENPLHSKNILRWMKQHGPKILLVLLAMFALRYVVRTTDQRLVQFMVNRGLDGSKEERENRARTLMSVFHNFAMLLVWCGGGLMILEAMGIPVVPLMGGAAILGLAVAFGAQNLIKDYFYGFVILLENQYAVNDIIRIGQISGQVERITLRMTVLRDAEGVVHFIPHGQVSSVSNMTQNWSKVVLNIGVSYKEDPDHVMEVMDRVGRELRKDPLFSDLILEDPEMNGVNEMTDSAIVIRMGIKTKPLQQWKVKREMLRRIKKTFNELKIEIPFPQRVIYHRHENEGDAVKEEIAKRAA